MKRKYILLGIILSITFSIFAQTGKTEMTITKSSVTELKIKTQNINELKNFDWNMITEIFEENDENQEITLAFEYSNNSEIDKTKVRLDKFEFKVTGKTSELENLTDKLKRTFEKLAELDGMNKN